jgi:hypothetical protein
MVSDPVQSRCPTIFAHVHADFCSARYSDSLCSDRYKQPEDFMSNNTVPAARLAMLGAVLWVIGVAAIHFASPIGVFAARLAFVVLLAAVPMAWGTVRLARRICVASGAGLVEAVGLVALPAALLDGIALTWAPGLHATDAADQRAAAAWLLWFLGASFAAALAMSPRREA